MHKSSPLFTLKEYKLQIDTYMPPPEPSGWERVWHGYYHMVKTTVGQARETFQKLFTEECYNSFVLEMFSLLSILEEIDSKHLNFFELGSGRAPWCMTVAGAVRFNLVPTPPSSYRLLAVEAEPTHFEWSKEHLFKQNINAEVVYGAITAKVGTCRFKADTDPAGHMGQCVSPDGNIEVPTYTIDYLRETYLFDHIDIIHMDIQGMEVEAIKGASKSLNSGIIDYIIIGTHGKEVEQELKSLLGRTHNLVVELPAHHTLKIQGIEKPFRSVADGVHVYKRKT